MNESNKTLRNKLLNMEKTNPSHREDYEKQVQEMIDRKLNHLTRAGFAALALLCLLAVLDFSIQVIAILGPGFFRHGVGGFFYRIFFIIAEILALAGAFLTSWVALTGKFKFRMQAPITAEILLALGFSVVAQFIIQWIIPITLDNPVDWRSIFGIQLALIGFFLLVIIGIVLIIYILYQTGFKTREKLLEIEYHLAELAEKLEGKTEKK